MKLITLNVALFESNNLKLAKFLKDQRADILCLQEVTKEIDTTVLHEYVTKRPVDTATTELIYAFFGPNSIMDRFDMKGFHGHDAFHFDLGGLAEMGNYTKSKFKITKGQNIFLQNHFTYTTDRSKWPDEDYRTVLVTDLEIGKKQLRVLNYHGIWTRNKLGNEKSLKACEKINKLALEAEGEAIICGDFNLFPGTPSMKVFRKNFTSLVDKFEIKTTRPFSNELNKLDRNVVDYIWVSKGIKVNNFEVLDNDVSDHLPLV
ncbi:hypothetical protein A2422_01855 [Candidatus Woesebacteria bacterium RIFOXYC1_FULL_31_51]|uniref:Endonuclease/exonuclease/phosphatase n=1 Tax=Candidatus Woesebacteria bacterium GW2011_GWC2_31_9 TaxID=1618586 RepID=A0A0F9YK76_9BACT|nr:MAG: Endonuclease/exonuclease/phosphatase [Candidatus Woesebacteria bacterium GW2011_GWF1_31_35]KKP23626.1 MAG: Endonuclease/exonuclease/phosphatase [Candidatus Woesebacteria bacterium GW2011_GWC1_30_29]KKP26993.1 MAG: Endonuclease/exonuclease/phosphatase [Candidatus Woesebacteria bacterium GW2011_GWD1_31_12]KKP27901.1 MAG: Endonuclease/exonuclease/phosphatase [Candidatus Woesebacteria bacterium GW2011_GWB1_31_29]KKP31904.1 MAG: Endonuclease/exonuclease/phosphatase [Candidatus Woesebacteria 